MIKVSVITAAYNAAKYITYPYQSLINQTSKNWDWWVVDDGSTDETVAVVQGFTDARVHLLRQANQGPGIARNLGLRASQSEYVLFLDADDWLAPNALELLCASIDAQTGFGGVHCKWAYADVQGNIGETRGEPIPADNPLEHLILHTIIPIHTILCRRSILQSVGGFRSVNGIKEDWDLWLRVVANGSRFTYIPHLLAYYYWHPGSRSKEIGDNLVEHIATLDYLFGEKNFSIQANRFRGQAYARAYLNCAISQFGISEENTALENLSKAKERDPNLFLRFETFYRIASIDLYTDENVILPQTTNFNTERSQKRLNKVIKNFNLSKKEQSIAIAALGVVLYNFGWRIKARSFLWQAIKLDSSVIQGRAGATLARAYTPVWLIKAGRRIRQGLKAGQA